MSDSVVPARFDDRLSTVLIAQPATARERAAVWRQVADMLAQSGPEMLQAEAARGLAALAVLRPHVPVAVRLEAARSIASRCRFAPLAVLMGNDEPAIAVALFDRLALAEEDWLTILPMLTPLARSRLRARSDLGLPVRRALDSLGPVDFSLPPADLSHAAPPSPTAAVEAAHPVAAGSNIAELVERIEAYRRRPVQPANDAARQIDDAAIPTPDRHDILIDSEGWLRAVVGLPRAAFVGLLCAAPAAAGEPGVDAAVARLFAKRGNIRGGRLQLHGSGPWSGCWLIDADAQFDGQSGRFLGYRGTIGFAAAGAHDDAGQAGQDAPEAGQVAARARPVADGMRQMAHELRSPLNAINGFAQLIEGQYFGPVAGHYRSLAASIVADAHRLGQMIDDLDMAAKLDTGVVERGAGVSEIAQMLIGFEGDCVTGDNGTDAELRVFGTDQPLEVDVPGRDLHQLLQRLIGLAASSAEAGAVIKASLSRDAHGNALVELTCPETAGQTNEFAARLVKRMAEIHGGSLAFADGKALLSLPCARNQAGHFELIR